MKNILVTGASGQIGSELTPKLRDEDGIKNVVASDIEDSNVLDEPFEILDVLNKNNLIEIVERYDIDTIFHLASILSAKGEKNPNLAYQVNINGLYNVLEVTKEKNLEKLIVPSSIAVFGPETPDVPTEKTITRPNTIYGISKVFLELMASYYDEKFDLDIRGVRFPGLLSYKTKPGGGTTDYAVEVFYEAIKEKKYEYFVRRDTRLPMMYMPDAIKALIQLSKAEKSNLRYHCDYNVNSMCFRADELTEEIKKHIPNFEAEYKPDNRQKIADSWPCELDDTSARKDWNWSPEFGLEEMVEDMIKNLRGKL